MTNSTQPNPSFRVGMGYDVHKLVEGRDLYLGGIKIEHSLGLLGHSDADVLIHAICDALLGAANMRDIGYHFPDTSADTLDMDSKIILRKTIDLLRRCRINQGHHFRAHGLRWARRGHGCLRCMPYCERLIVTA